MKDYFKVVLITVRKIEKFWDWVTNHKYQFIYLSSIQKHSSDEPISGIFTMQKSTFNASCALWCKKYTYQRAFIIILIYTTIVYFTFLNNECSPSDMAVYWLQVFGRSNIRIFIYLSSLAQELITDTLPVLYITVVLLYLSRASPIS